MAGFGSFDGSGGPVKLEFFEDDLEEEHGPFCKKVKHPSLFGQGIDVNDLLPIAPSQYNPLDEPSPLGLRLRKTPSLLDLIQKGLSHGFDYNPGSVSSDNPTVKRGVAKGKRSTAVQINEKLKSGNFPALLLRIGCWEYTSRHEGNLVGKCYFARHKLVWEILNDGLKSKIEILWSDIVGLNAKFPLDGPASVTIVLGQQPLFYKEIDPKPRKHTLWQATADFTNGQASIYRKHFLQIPLGVFNKHFETLIQSDERLNFLSHQPEMVLDSPYFEPLPPVLQYLKYPPIRTLDAKTFSNLTDGPATSSVTSESYGRSKMRSLEAASPNSVMNGQVTEGSANSDAESQKNWEQVLMQGLRPSMSMSDLVNHIGSYISGQGSMENPSFAEEGSEPRKVLEDIAQHLLGDAQVTCTDENSIMKRVNSLCCLLQKDPTVPTPVQLNTDLGLSGFVGQKDAYIYNSATDENSLMKRVNSFRCLLQKDPTVPTPVQLNTDLGLSGFVGQKDAHLYNSPTDENSLMKRVNSFRCLLQKDPAVPAPVQLNTDLGLSGFVGQKDAYLYSNATELTDSGNIAGSEGDSKEISSSRPAMPRIDSYGDLLLNLPRIASLPQFLFQHK